MVRSESNVLIKPPRHLHIVLTLLADEGRGREVLVAQDDLLDDVEPVTKVASL